jgi:hypothetical protein
MTRAIRQLCNPRAAAAVVAALIAAAFATDSHARSDRFLLDWHNEAGAPVRVLVIPDSACPGEANRGCAALGFLAQGIALVFLGHNEKRLAHELAHVAGMRHGPWRRNGFGAECSVVTEGGYGTGYAAGDLICAGFDGSDLIERRRRVVEAR